MVQTILSIAVIAITISFSFWTLLRRDRSLPAFFVVLALLVTSLLETCTLLLLLQPERFAYWEGWSLFVEAFIPGVWLLASTTHGREAKLSEFRFSQKTLLLLSLLFIVPVFLTPAAGFYYSPDFPFEPVLFLGPVGFPFYIGIMAFLVAALINLETTLVNASPGELWKMKFTTLGIGTILAAYALYYSQALLFRTLNLNFLSIRSFFLILAVGMMTFGRLRKGDGVKIRVSRHVAFKSVVLITVGGYLVLIGLLGEGMRYFGAEFQRSVVIGFIILSGLVLLFVFLSGRVRREILVFLHKNFYQSKYDYRVQWLQFTERLANRQSEADLQQVILSAYCDIFGIQCAALYLVDPDRRNYVNTAVYEMEALPETFGHDNVLVRYIDGRGWVFRHTDNFLEVPAETKEFLKRYQVSFVVPLLSGEQLEGFIVLGRQVNPNETVMYEDFDLMKTIARQASFALRNQRLSDQLTRLREMEAIGNIATFVIHDLKNHVAGLSLMVDNARHYIDNPEFQQDMLRSLDNTVTKMQGLIGKLKNLGEKELLNLQPIDLRTVVRRAMAFLPAGRVAVSGEPLVVKVDADELQKVFLNLLLNAVEATPDGSPVTVEVAMAGAPHVRVIDQGTGMSADYIRRELFKPFVTTKKKGLGIGLYQSRQIVEAHGGRLEVQSEVGKGTVFTVWLK
jgi:putative PEP-CTERM system histidine kinase